MTDFENLVKSIEAETGLRLKPAADGIVEMASEGRIILLKPESYGEYLTLFTVVATVPGIDDPESGAGRAVMSAALKLSLFGRETIGGYLGLFADSIIFSRTMPIEGVDAGELINRMIAFARLANGIEERLEGSVPVEDVGGGLGSLPAAGAFEMFMA